MPSTIDPIAFRPMQHSDLPLLQRWLQMPHVDAFWREPFDMAGVVAKYGPRIDGVEPTHMFVIEHDGRAIGWIQWYFWCDYSTQAAQLSAELASAGVDLAIGEVEMLGRGIGPCALRKFVEGVVFADSAIKACICDPEERNTRSLRAFEKAGFKTVRTVVLAGETYPRCVVRLDRPA
jgi:RimJ/RimL family protein N-acetyltransferase